MQNQSFQLLLKVKSFIYKTLKNKAKHKSKSIVTSYSIKIFVVVFYSKAILNSFVIIFGGGWGLLLLAFVFCFFNFLIFDFKGYYY